jgi:hypothetical protein
LEQGKYQHNPLEFEKAKKVTAKLLKTEQGYDDALAEITSPNMPTNPGQMVSNATEIYNRAIKDGKQSLADNIIDNVTEKLTRLGQGVSLSRMFLDSTPAGKERIILKALDKVVTNTPNLDKLLRTSRGKFKVSNEFKTFLRSELQSISKLEGKNKEIAEIELLRSVANYVPTGANDFITQMRINGILSNPRTQMRNILSNTWQLLFTNPATKLLKGDPVGSARYYRDMLGNVPEAIQNMKDNFKNAGSVKGELNQSNVMYMIGGRGNMKTTSNIWDKAIGITTAGKLPGRMLEAEDVFFHTLISKGEIPNLMKKGLSLEEATLKADEIAEHYLFRGNISPQRLSEQGYLLNGIDKMANWVQRGPAAIRWIAPFIRTPANIIKQGVEYSPAGFATTLGAKNKSEQVAKALLGTGVFTLGDRKSVV